MSVFKTSYDKSLSNKEHIRLNPNWSDSKKQEFNKKHPYFVPWTEDEKQKYIEEHPNRKTIWKPDSSQ
jgi:hypothetical protein